MPSQLTIVDIFKTKLEEYCLMDNSKKTIANFLELYDDITHKLLLKERSSLKKVVDVNSINELWSKLLEFLQSDKKQALFKPQCLINSLDILKSENTASMP